MRQMNFWLFLVGYVIGQILGQFIWSFVLRPLLEEWEWRHDG